MKYAEEKHSNKCCTHFNRIDYKCPIVLKISINHTGLFDTFLPITENARIMIRYTFCDNIVFNGIHRNTSHRRCMKGGSV